MQVKMTKTCYIFELGTARRDTVLDVEDGLGKELIQAGLALACGGVVKEYAAKRKYEKRGHRQ